MKITPLPRILCTAIVPLLAACATIPTPTNVPQTPTRPAFPTAAPTIMAPTNTPTLTPTARPPVATPQPTATSIKPAIPSLLPIPTAIGAGWEPRTLLVAPGEPGRLYALMVNTGTGSGAFPAERMRFLFSDDFGATWTPFPSGLPTEIQCVNNVNLDYASRDALYASTCQGLYRWVSNHWTRVSPQETFQVAVAYGQPKVIWATARTDQGGPAIRSDDGGATWRTASAGLVHFNGVANVAIDPRDVQTLYAIIWPKYAGSYLRRAKASGQWKMLPTPLGNAQIDVGMSIDGATGELYVSAYNSINEQWGIWRSRNPTVDDVNAVIWEHVHTFPKDQWVTVLASGSSPKGLALYARVSILNGESVLQRSLDGGQTWTALPIR